MQDGDIVLAVNKEFVAGSICKETRLPTLTIDFSHNLYYRLIPGLSSRPYLVFLHDGLGCTALWKKFPRHLCDATGCPGLLYDRLGYGKSSALRELRSARYLHDYGWVELPALLEETIPGKPFILVGHSDGGTISLLYGAKRPPLLQGIITEAAHVFVESKTLAGIRSLQKAWSAGKLQKLSRYHGVKTESVFTSWASTWLSAWFRNWNIESSLQDITAPVLAIQGRDDEYGTEAQVKTIVDKSSGVAEFAIIEQCGHVPHREAPAVVLELMTRFIAKGRA